ncbi:hypothetical protein AB6E21_14145 [Photobacterium swingsii]|uniref:hypothetical protein n=1 Tax=Photobacterium swingsii TaxID=680026 RepID=UPI00354CA520
MKQAIEFTHQQHPYLSVGPRRKSMTSYMVAVTQGAALIRLGKNEHLIPQGHGFWVPFDCLHALTILPGSEIKRVDISSRVTHPVCGEAGFFSLSPLVCALLAELENTAPEQQVWEGPYGRLLGVLKDQLVNIKVDSKALCPELSKHYQESLKIALKGDKVTDQPAAKVISEKLHINLAELEVTLLMREALRLARSGRKPEKIAEELSVELKYLETLSLPILGKPLAALNA